MTEDIISSGRANHLIDPVLEVWEWHIPSYLFLGGLAAGILFFAGLTWLRKKEAMHPTSVKIAPLIVPLLLVLGLFFLFLDLKHKLYFWRLYTTIKLGAPMSWGAWVLMAVTPLSFIWAALHIKEVFPDWDWKFDLLKRAEQWLSQYKTWMAWAMVVLAVVLGVYTGILFSAFNGRPLWNTSILGPLFLVSGMSGGAAVIVLMSRSKEERHYFAKVDLLLIAIELVLIVHMFMGFLASTQTQIDAAQLFLGGEYTAPFWIFVVIMGLILPALFELMEMRNKKIPWMVAPVLVLFGGIMLRFIIAYAGQVSQWKL
ncbi:MAG TPA: polysulfide reductase NrfD [Prolixibacteraceae bacterium]|nr:polysulfide reductase NrfD [Prolixibacteraceae bacterium]